MPRKAPFRFDNTYARELDGFYAAVQGDRVPAPAVLRLNDGLARELDLDPDYLQSPEGAAVLTGSAAPEGSSPIAQIYAGHQFGGFVPQLGDGRAILVGEVVDRSGRRRDIHLKGSGRTPFSRGGDGKAVLGPMLREYLIGEAMHALGIPTTRALSVATTGEEIMREDYQPGAVLARVAASHLRVGTFQYFAAREDRNKLRILADYAIRRHDPGLEKEGDRYLHFLRAVIDRQIDLVARWMGVGFVHGVMNTDNTTISGETIDYGPCAFIDRYDPKAVFSSIDRYGRYAYGNQPAIAQWNLARFAETLLDLLDPSDQDRALQLASDEIARVPALYEGYWFAGMRRKLGLSLAESGDPALVRDLLAAMDAGRPDFTLLFRSLAGAVRGDPSAARALFADPAPFDAWLPLYLDRLSREPGDPAASMDLANPLYIPRNHLVEEALRSAVESGDLAPFDLLLSHVRSPFALRPDSASFASPPPPGTPPVTTFCGT